MFSAVINNPPNHWPLLKSSELFTACRSLELELATQSLTVAHLRPLHYIHISYIILHYKHVCKCIQH